MTLFTIGHVVGTLQPEFPDLSISKLRYLEDQGLITPTRTTSGYRKFSEDDIRRLRYILAAQRDRYLPLKVIRDELDRLEDMASAPSSAETPLAAQPVEPDAAAPDVLEVGDDAAPSAPVPAGIPDARTRPHEDPSRSLRELAEHLGVDVKELRQLRDNGLLGPDEPYGAAEQRIARWALVLIRDGLEARHLRMYAQFVDRELAMVEQLVQPLLRQRNPEASRGARLLASDLGEASSRLHGALLSRALEAMLEA